MVVNSGNSAGSISGGGNLIKTGASTLQLSGSNSYTGTTFISNGVVAINTNAALAGTTLINLNNGTALAYSGGSSTIDRNISVTNGTAAIRNTGGGTLTLAGSLSKNGTVLVFSNGTFNVTGVISGASANSDLVVDNATVTLSNANTYVGPTFIRNAGTLNAAVVGAMPTATRSALVMDDTGSGSSIFNVTASQQIASLTGAASSSATIATNTSLTIGTTSGNTTFAGAISGGGSLVKDGASTQTLTGNNTYSGGTLVSAGVLAGNTGSLQGNITNNASVVFDQAIDGTYSGSLSGTGSLTKTSAGTLTVTGANTQSGTTITAGALQVGNGGSTGSLSGPITNNASLIFNRSDDAPSVGDLISGSGSVTKLGSGTVTLTGDNTYSGATTIGGGVLVANTLANAGSASSFGSGSSVVITNNGVLRYVGASTSTDRNINLAGAGNIGVSNSATALTVTGVISNTGSLSKFGQGTLVLSGANTYTGATTVSAGTLNLNNATGAALGSTASVTVGGGLNAVLLLSQSDQVNDTAAVTLSGGTIRTPGGVSQVFGDLTVTGSGFLDFGATSYATASQISFGEYTPSSLLTINNFDYGSTLSFNADLRGTINNTSLFAFTNGGIASSSWDGTTFTITAIPEPSTYAAAVGLIGLMLWPARRRLLAAAKGLAAR